ncbi:class F sortase [Actinomycetospora chibensis]|uniref:Class F sortase n=1 Tax=Actinomycetospora chibensis TaxID=663606 RepID=A0ABV9RM09_9PSEU|nr:class F sortase [Actinomycetospora chibensis]MDD7926977.1 class F sortase [Actinomycetospora chibensis]
MTRGGAALPLVAVVTGVALAVWGFDLAPRAVDADIDLGVVPPTASIASTPPSLPALVTSARATAAETPPGPPTRLLIPALDVDAPVDPVDAPGADLQVPDDPARVGWWRAGASPDGGSGSTLLAGHVDTAADGPGALFLLDRLGPGDAVSVLTTWGEVRYVVAAVRHYAKPELPGDLASAAGPARLVIVSCGGPFDRVRRTYLDNVVVFATPA